jgi:hypothetical protein
VLEGIEEGDDVLPTWMMRVRGHDLLEQLDLVLCRLCIAGCRLDDLQSRMTIVPMKQSQRWVQVG